MKKSYIITDATAITTFFRRMAENSSGLLRIKLQKLTFCRYVITILLLLMNSYLYSIDVGKILPTISLRDSDQKFFQLNKLSGKPMVLMAFNLACKFCDPEIKLLNEISQKHTDKLQIFLINSDPITRKSEVMEKLNKLNSALPILFDKNQDYTEGVTFPYTIVTDSNLIVKLVLNGFNEETKSKISKSIEDTIK
jgi:peroxiredoxin